MKEPNLDGMIQFLYDLGYELTKFSSNNIFEILLNSGRDISKEIVQIIYFSSNERAETVENEILQISDEKRKYVFSALVALYPLTQSIVVQMIKKADVKPTDFLEFYDCNNDLLRMIKNNVELIKNSSQFSNLEVNEYSSQVDKLQKEVDELEKQREILENSIEGYREKFERKEQLNRDIKDLERIKESGVDKKIADLEKEKQRLENEKEEKERNREKLCNEVSLLKEELKQVSGGISEKYQDALNNLQKCIAELGK